MPSRLSTLRDEYDLPETAWKSFAKGRPIRELLERVAKGIPVPIAELKSATQFADAVETIVGNCGRRVLRTLFDEQIPQSRTAIMCLSRTADTRPRYRIDGVRAGRFRSVKPQNDDPVFDTVTFSEVTSRLRRGRGAIRLLRKALRRRVAPDVRHESQRLAELCRRSAAALQQLEETLEETLEEIGGNSGAGPNNQEACTKMASRFKMWIEHSVGGSTVDLGMKADNDGRLYTNEEAEAVPELETQPAPQVSDDLLKKWMEILRHCGGFEVW